MINFRDIPWGECMYDINDKRAAVFAVQSLLRNAGYDVKPDGIFGEETARAVRAFQSASGVTPSGRVDLYTFELLVLAAESPAAYKCVSAVPKLLEGGRISPGEESNVVIIIQAMLRELESVYDFEIEVNGVYDSNTENAVKDIQRVYGLTPNGIIDASTWNVLVEEYEKYKSER